VLHEFKSFEGQGEAIKKEKKSSSRKGVRVMEMDRSVAFCIRASRPYLVM
jgi:hypothetical protein